ncbi:MAG: YqhA family protein, partial [Bdellovibrionales bacterium]|nr:YqhA family protein [Bdellovibrionales bacterium]
MGIKLCLKQTISSYLSIYLMSLNQLEDRPDWLQKINAGTLKVKVAGALIGISSIHLLKSFVDIGKKDLEQVKWQIIIHIVFLFSTLALAFTEKLIHSPEMTSGK